MRILKFLYLKHVEPVDFIEKSKIMKIDQHCFEVKENYGALKFFYLGVNSPTSVQAIIFILVFVYLTKLSTKLILPFS